MPDLAKIAIWYLAQSRELIPLRGKIPIHKNWTNRHFTKQQILHYIKRGFNVGWKLGPTDLVIDIDPKNDGFHSLARLRSDLRLAKLDTIAPTVITGSGGKHFYFKKPKQKLKATLRDYPGIDLKQLGGQVVIPGSIHPSGTPYRLDRHSPYAETPKIFKRLYERLVYSSNSTSPHAAQLVSNKKLKSLLDQIEVADYNTNDLWFPLLAASHHATVGQGLEEFLEWSLSDPLYIDHEQQIRSRWQSLDVDKHAGYTIATLREAADTPENTFDEISKSAPKTKDPGLLITNRVLETYHKNGDFLIYAADQNYWIYDKTHWRILSPNVIDHQALEVIRSQKRKSKTPIATILNQTIRLLKADRAKDVDLFNPKRGLQSVINTRNTEIWIKPNGKITLRDHKHNSYLTQCLNADYDKSATCPKFDQTLQEIFTKHKDVEDIIRHLWEVIGYIIQPRKDIAIWILFHGRGSNGKTVVLNIISSLLDEFALQKPISDISTTRNNHALAELPNKLVLIDEDLDSRTILPDSAIKKISENKMLTANPKGAREFKFRNTAVTLLAANSWPQTKDLSSGLRRRALIFSFNRVFTPEEMDLSLADGIVKTELSGILNRALNGYRRLRKRNQFKIPLSCRHSLDTWFLQSNQLLQFVYECYKQKSNYSVGFTDLWENYRLWAENQGVKRSYSKRGLRLGLNDSGFSAYNSGRVVKILGLKCKVDLVKENFE